MSDHLDRLLGGYDDAIQELRWFAMKASVSIHDNTSNQILDALFPTRATRWILEGLNVAICSWTQARVENDP